MISDELSRGEVEKREVGRVFPGRYPYGSGDADREDDSGCLGGYLAANNPVLAAAKTAAVPRTSLWVTVSMRRAAWQRWLRLL